MTSRSSSNRARVWAPTAQRVVLQADGRHFSMSRQLDGWWTAERPMHDGDLYGFLVDDRGPFPDPRSASQPDGVHGLSQWIDHARFTWTDTRWQAPPLSSSVIYELHVGTFTEEGTFEGVIRQLPHLLELGVTHVELMPVAEFSGDRGWGYDGVDLFAPHHAYGSTDALKRLIDACHANGLAVILDVVYNHLGPAGNYLEQFGPYFTRRYSTPWGDAINFDDAGSDEVRRFFCDNALMWLRDYHADALRLDAVQTIVDTSATHFLEQLANEVDRLEATEGRHYALIAESDLNDPRVVLAREAGGYGIDAQWSDDFHHALHSLLTGERSGYYADFGSADHLAQAIRDGFVYRGRHSTSRRRVHGRAPIGVPGWRLIVATQTHDQVGNRALGERLAQLVSPGRARIAAALLLCGPFVPMVFQGEEWSASTPFLYFTAHDDPALAAQVSAGRQREMSAHWTDVATVPDPQADDTFRRSRLVWAELGQRGHVEMFEWYRHLIALRRSRPSLGGGDYKSATVTLSNSGEQLTMARGPITVACNWSADPARLDLDRTHCLLLGSSPGIAATNRTLTLPPESVAILQHGDMP